MDNFNYAIMKNPDFAPAYAERAKLFFSSGNKEEALKDIDRAIALQPNCIELEKIKKAFI
jgi:tetratricopeptide (TPR) repeat protein